MHAAEPGGANVPAGHFLQFPVFGEGADPAVHINPQPTAPVNVDDAPSELDGHCTQALLPARPAKVVAGQILHEREPGADEKRPAGHC